MTFLPLREVATSRESADLYDAWLRETGAALEDGDRDRNAVVRDLLKQIYFPSLGADVDESRLPSATRAALANLDPRSTTLEPEYYRDIDPELYYERKALIWLWQMFDRSPLGANVDLGVRFRRLLAPYVFKRVGRNFKAFHFVEVSYGYNLEVGDDVVIHRNVHLDDRGGITIGDRVSISDYAAVFSHTHSINEINEVTCVPTVIGDDVRITYGAVVLAGVHLGTHGMVGARALATRDVRPYHVNVGIPAKSVRVKSIAPPEFQPDVNVPHDS
ncbi:MAG: acyltransferase [Gemmatimonadetes bacterium]|nr:acyltransferase [Gemmatimonadota bacterium]